MTQEEIEQYIQDNRAAIDGITKTLSVITTAIDRIVKYLGL